MWKFLSILMIGLTFTSLQAQDTERYSQESIDRAKASGEILVFEQQTIDLGVIKKGSKPEFTYRFLNIGNEDIDYSFFDVCSCSELTYAKGEVIKPGEEGTFHIVFNSNEREDEEPVEVNFELKNKDPRNGMGFFYTVYYLYKFKK